MGDSTEPRAPKRSTREWLFQLTTITIGVLIALSFDAVLKWNADRALVREARETLALEIADNRKIIETHLASLAEQTAKLDAARQLLENLLAGNRPPNGELSVGLDLPSLSDASWLTAERTGALALMDYADVQSLARLYDRQEFAAQNQRELFSPLAAALTAIAASDNPMDAPPEAQRELLARVIDLRTRLWLHEQFARQLAAAYAEYEAEAPKAN